MKLFSVSLTLLLILYCWGKNCGPVICCNNENTKRKIKKSREPDSQGVRTWTTNLTTTIHSWCLLLHMMPTLTITILSPILAEWKRNCKHFTNNVKFKGQNLHFCLRPFRIPKTKIRMCLAHFIFDVFTL